MIKATLDELLTPPEAARVLKHSISWLAKRRLDGDGQRARQPVRGPDKSHRNAFELKAH